MHSPAPRKFTHALSLDEQLALSPGDAEAYTDWFVRNVMEAPIKPRVEWWSDSYLDGDYGKGSGSWQKHETGE
jgi:hypothetical protein